MKNPPLPPLTDFVFFVFKGTAGSHAKTCPSSVAAGLADQEPRILENVKIHKVKLDEWEPLLKILKDIEGDCNFWYTN